MRNSGSDLYLDFMLMIRGEHEFAPDGPVGIADLFDNIAYIQHELSKAIEDVAEEVRKYEEVEVDV